MSGSDDPNIPRELAEHERWLASFPTPAPSDRTIERVKSAVRAELAADRRRDRSPRRDSLTYRLAGALAAAAVLAAAVGLIEFVVPTGDSPAYDMVAMFGEVADDLSDQDALASLRLDLERYASRVEADAASEWLTPASGNGDVLEQFEAILTESDATYDG
ncbi:MAG TPA: hypothetical protein VMZ31_15310 [Phycisphaerae bacterium]|nr:hypothetical protein [Phycisphaerae bacterium]